jgi:hypothetical protein
VGNGVRLARRIANRNDVASHERADLYRRRSSLRTTALPTIGSGSP